MRPYRPGSERPAPGTIPNPSRYRWAPRHLPLPQHLTVYLMAILLLAQLTKETTAQLIGTVAKCDQPDGDSVHIPGISDNPCISCLCKKGKVECSKEKCPSLEGCHTIVYDKPENQCCKMCKGCYHQGAAHASGTSWIDARKPCRRFICQAGVVTRYRAECHVACQHPLVYNDRCCPVCEGCQLNGNTYTNGASFPSPKDTCATCRCDNGTIECVKQACPVLNCPDSHVTTAPGACCPVCTKSHNVYDLKKRACLFRNRIYYNETTTRPDPCTNCTCLDGTMVCNRHVCPTLHCAIDDVIYDPAVCCPTCRVKKKLCKLRGKSHKHGATWWVDACTRCNCDDGTVRCHMQQCRNDIECPKNAHLQHVRGKCCPACVESDAVCAVFGDPHYRTFDGRIYNFQGTCNYILTQDCVGGNFSIRVRNDARLTNDFAWTKGVSVLLAGNLRISLQQRLRVKVNGQRVSLPFEQAGVLVVMEGGHSVTLRTTFGLRIIWDGDSYLEVSISPRYKNHLCGLCGNYNSVENDDFVGRNGALYFDSNEFAETWRTGRRSACGKKRREKKGPSVCQRSAQERMKATRECSILRGPVFSKCRSKVDVEPYYKSCIVDMCDCPGSKVCACEVMTAYSRECQRQGIHVQWRTPNLCGAPGCPRGATFNVCASACPRTCSNWDKPVVCDKPCVPACQCPAGTILKGNRCVKPQKCLRNRKKKSKKKSKPNYYS